MSSVLLRLLIEMDMSGCETNFSPLKYHEKSKGLSPTDTVHMVETDSPEFTGRSPNEKGAICGATDVTIVKAYFLK